jgi:hypothetical protein
MPAAALCPAIADLFPVIQGWYIPGMFSKDPLQRGMTWLSIVGYALVASGLQLPCAVVPTTSDTAMTKRAAAKDRSRPFPCMDKPCGCATAEQCFKNCCCHTPAERLAWAKAHSVEPAVLVTLERLAAKPARPRPQTCCEKKRVPHLDLGGPDMCSAYRSFASSPPAASDVDTTNQTPSAAGSDTDGGSVAEEPRSTRSISLRAMLACGGIVAEWLQTSVTIPVCSVELPLRRDVLFESRPVGDDVAESRPSSPEVPPPRA